MNESLDELEKAIKDEAATVETIDEKLKASTDLVQKHAEALYKAASEKDKPTEEAKAEGDATETKSDTKNAEEGEVVE